MGIDTIPDAVLRRLHASQDLGVHTEMFSDGLVELAKSGAITNRLKPRPHRDQLRQRHPTRRRLRQRQPVRRFHPCDRTNDTAIIRMNDKVTAIDSALDTIDGGWRHRQPNRAVTQAGRRRRDDARRAQALIGIAHPDVRGDLRRAFADTRHVALLE
jgi:acyl-CoA hydrolase